MTNTKNGSSDVPFVNSCQKRKSKTNRIWKKKMKQESIFFSVWIFRLKKQLVPFQLLHQLDFFFFNVWGDEITKFTRRVSAVVSAEGMCLFLYSKLIKNFIGKTKQSWFIADLSSRLNISKIIEEKLLQRKKTFKNIWHFKILPPKMQCEINLFVLVRPSRVC